MGVAGLSIDMCVGLAVCSHFLLCVVSVFFFNSTVVFPGGLFFLAGCFWFSPFYLWSSAQIIHVNASWCSYMYSYSWSRPLGLTLFVVLSLSV